ncbi:MAG: hypothetical protein AB7T10_04015 [bacterium]
MFLVLFVGCILLIFLFKKRISYKRKMTAFWAVIFLIIFVLSFLVRFPYRAPVFISDDEVNFIEFSKASKYDRAKELYSSSAPLIITAEDKKNLISENNATLAFLNLTDIGIDTAYLLGETLFVSVLNYSLHTSPCRLKVFNSDSAIVLSAGNDSLYRIFPFAKADSVLLESNDDNPYNNKFYFARTKRIALVSSVYSPALQKFSMALSAIFDSVVFNTMLLKNSLKIGLNDDYDGIILLGGADYKDIALPRFSLQSPLLDGDSYLKVSDLIKRVGRDTKRIKNPFNPASRIRDGIFDRLLLNLKSNILRTAAFCGFTVCLLLLF